MVIIIKIVTRGRLAIGNVVTFVERLMDVQINVHMT